LEDSQAAELIQKFDELNRNQRLLLTGEVIPDFTGVEYYLKVNGKWEKKKIELIGEVPEGPLQEELSREQLDEIKTQEDESRICCMTPEQKTEAIQRELDALADEAARLEKRAQIQETVFDPVAWYQERVPAVREKYSVTHETQ
jgi:fructose-1-phosphate kinase PfkB-like protein